MVNIYQTWYVDEYFQYSCSWISEVIPSFNIIDIECLKALDDIIDSFLLATISVFCTRMHASFENMLDPECEVNYFETTNDRFRHRLRTTKILTTNAHYPMRRQTGPFCLLHWNNSLQLLCTATGRKMFKNAQVTIHCHLPAVEPGICLKRWNFFQQTTGDWLF